MNINEYSSLPLGSLVWRSEEEEDHYLKLFVQMPPAIKKLVTAEESGAFIRGLAKSYKVEPAKTSRLAFIVLQVAAGEIKFNELAGQLSSNFALVSNQAQSLAQEIEKDLFGAVRQELREHWAKSKHPPTQPMQASQNPSPPPAAMPPNLLNLKEQPKVIPPPPMPPGIKS